MYINNKILIGKNGVNEANLLLNMANRHGLITGASGSGKTITLKVLAESFAEARVPVFLVDIKGDLAGMVNPGDQVSITERINKLELNLPTFTCKNFKTTFWDVYGEAGIPVRTTIENIGPKLLSRMLNLTDAQEGVLTIVFKIAEDMEMELIDLNDLKAMLNYVGMNRKEYTLSYGNITTQSIGAIQRNLLNLEEEGGDLFFGKPDLEIKDFIRYDANTGESYINILHAVKLFQRPTLYATFMLWLIDSLYQYLPEVGDLEKPKVVFFFDEAHLLFSEMPDHMVKQIIQIVKIIRSKGIGLYFISQSPNDIPDEILSQLGNRIQHVLRSYTKTDEKVIKACADSFRTNPNFDTEEVLKTLATGEALISLQDEDGQPTIVDRFKILPPQSQMGTIDDLKRAEIINASSLNTKYKDKVEYESAKEEIEAIIAEEQEKSEKEEKKEKTTKAKKNTKKKKTGLEKTADKLANKTINTFGSKLGNKIFNSLFK